MGYIIKELLTDIPEGTVYRRKTIQGTYRITSEFLFKKRNYRFIFCESMTNINQTFCPPKMKFIKKKKKYL